MKKSIQDDINKFLTLAKESDRGCVLVAGANLDVQLEQLHRTFIKVSSTLRGRQVNDLLEWPGPLSSFSARIRIGHAFGLLPGGVHDDLLKVKTIRNKAAHSDEEFQFKNYRTIIDEIVSCERLIMERPGLLNVGWRKWDDGKTLFVLAYLALTLELNFLINGIKPKS